MAIVWVYAMVRVDPTLSTLTIESARRRVRGFAAHARVRGAYAAPLRGKNKLCRAHYLHNINKFNYRYRTGWIQSKLRNKMLPATAKKLVMVHMWLRIETMKESGKWEADLLQHTDEDRPDLGADITSLDED